MGSLVAVDGGRSRCRAAVIGADGRPGPVVEGPGIPPGTGRSAADGIAESVAVTVTSAVVAAAAARHEVGQVAAVSAGLAGLLGARDLAPAVAGRLHDRLGAAGVTLCGDVVAAHAGALPDPDGGVVLVAGTGAVAFGAVPVRVPAPSPCADADRTLVGPLPGLGPTGAGGSDSAAADSAGAGRSAADSAGAGRSAGADGAGDGRAAPGSGDGWNDPGVADGAWVVDSAVACVDGWGHLLGDTGSGFWIGRRGLDAALRAHDGRGGGSPRLARLVERDIGPLDRLPDMAARAGAGPVAAIASFSVQVAEAASEGDEIARFIWLEAAAALADSAVACARRLHPEGAVPTAISWVGGLFSAPGHLLLEPFLARVRSIFPAADLMPPAGDALAGAARLAAPGSRGALAGLVFDSSASRRAPVTA